MRGSSGRLGIVPSVSDAPRRTILIATDADEVFDEVDAALSDEATTLARVRADLMEPGISQNFSGCQSWSNSIPPNLRMPMPAARANISPVVHSLA